MPNLGLLWFDLVVYKVSAFYYVWNWSKSLVWWVVVFKATFVFIFGPSLKDFGLALAQADQFGSKTVVNAHTTFGVLIPYPYLDMRRFEK